MSTIFSKIIDGEVPADIIYEDDRVMAFLDIAPLQPGHTLVIPKTPSENGLATDPEDLAYVMVIAQRIALTLKEVLGCDGINFLMNNGAAAGQKVFHTHLHVIPRYTDDGVYEEPIHGEYEEGEAANLAQTISAALS
ncbi:MAG TPA: HIT family protein [Candidatus Paceibacterota bacterium]